MLKRGDAVVSYARYSTDRQDARSIDDQHRRNRAWAKDHDLRMVGEYHDSAESGTHTERDDLQRLLADARRKIFKGILADDLSRLSRDMGDMWTLIFGTLASVDVVVVDCMTSIESDSPAARMTFGAMGLVSDGFVQMIRRETHRGLEGRILGGFWTGGRVYGYGTRPEEMPPDPENVRMVPVIVTAEANMVRRIFVEFAAGTSLKGVADGLNRDGLPAPHDGGKGSRSYPDLSG